jgi:hypothetical protein
MAEEVFTETALFFPATSKPYFNNNQEMRHYALTLVVKKAGK